LLLMMLWLLLLLRLLLSTCKDIDIDIDINIIRLFKLFLYKKNAGQQFFMSPGIDFPTFLPIKSSQKNFFCTLCFIPMPFSWKN
jgi:hypothetical protein